ncbi:MAG: ATP-binding cassette domain-containing protein, partial [Christensenellales bacterium]
MIEVKNLYLSYIKEYYALCNISFTVQDKQKVAIIGEQESGKTTLLRTLCGLESFNHGEIYLNKTNIKNADFKKDINLLYLSSTPIFFNNKTVHHNLAYPLKLRGFPEELINKKINRALDCLGIEGLKEEKIKKLTANEKMIVNIARSLLRDA